MVTDKISNLINSLKIANFNKEESLVIPHTKLIETILNALLRENFIQSFDTKEKDAKKTIKVVLKYDEDGEPVIRGVKRVSKQSKRIYKGTKDIKRVRYGFDRSILTTPLGILSNKEAREKKVGGEVLFEIW